MLGLKLLEKIHVVIDQGKTGGLTTSEVGAESKTRDDVRRSFVHLGQFLSDFLLWHCGATGV